MTICFYHSADLDGHCSGAIVKYRYPACKMFGINYGDEFPWNEIEPNEQVFMVDFCLHPWSEMQKLDELCRLTWIDHHKSAIENHSKEPLENAHVMCTDGIAGCELTWAYLYHDKKVPMAVHWLGRYDVWDHSDGKTLPFQFGLRIEDTSPENQDLWEELFLNSGIIYDVLDAGETILKYIKQTNEKYADACAFEIEFEGLSCIVANANLTNSQLFDSVYDRSKHDVMLTFGWKKTNGLLASILIRIM